MASRILTLLTVAIALGSTIAGNPVAPICLPREQPDLTVDAIVGQQPLLPSIVAHHITSVTLRRPAPPLPDDTPLQREEKARLLRKLERGRGRWDEHHPRHRLLHALHAYVRYAERTGAEIQRYKNLYRHVSKPQKALLERAVQYSAKFTAVDRLLETNQALCDRLVAHALAFYDLPRAELDAFIRDAESHGRHPDRVAVSQSLRHFVRDWAAEGAYERDATFPCVLRTLDALFPSRGAAPDRSPRILLPGAGLGRLGHEVAAQGGFAVTVNEWSTYMNLAYRFLAAPEPFIVHPYIDGWSHHAAGSDLLRSVTVPDPAAAPLLRLPVVMVEGDFLAEFHVGRDGPYDAIVTHYFIDTARNLVSYLETIHRALKPGGVWVNVGPLLYGSGPFVQLARDEVVRLAEAIGFELEAVEEGVAGACGRPVEEGSKVRWMHAVYGSTERALNVNGYRVQYWVARKL